MSRTIWSSIPGLEKHNYADEAQAGDFVETGIALFESEDLTEALIRIFVSLMADGWSASSSMVPMAIGDFGEVYRHGLWLPCIPRVALAGQVDTRNDAMPDFAAIPIQRDGHFDFILATKQQTRPSGWCFPPFSGDIFTIGQLFRDASGRVERKLFGESLDSMRWDGWHYALIKDRLVPGKSPYGWPGAGCAGVCARYGSAAIQTVTDFKYLWNVETEEDVLGFSGEKTPLRLGVDAEIVKSLFYARQAPVTESGRRRPILHWVRSHQRRIKEGIDIDIRSHLRGIDKFEMDGFPFMITQPRKQTKLAA